jgi:hypothetical protein
MWALVNILVALGVVVSSESMAVMALAGGPCQWKGLGGSPRDYRFGGLQCFRTTRLEHLLLPAPGPSGSRGLSDPTQFTGTLARP